MSDVFTGQDAQDLLAFRETQADAVARDFGQIAQASRLAESALRGAQHDGQWTGQAADAFRQNLGSLPEDLQTVAESYGDAAHALDTYATQVAGLRTRFQALQIQAQSAQQSLTSAQGTLTSAQQTYQTVTTGSEPPKPQQITGAKNAVTSASSQVSQLQDEVSGLEGQAKDILDQFDAARGTVNGALAKAQDKAPSESWWHHALGDVENFCEGAFQGLEQFGKAALYSAERLPGDVANVVMHPTDLKDWGKFARDDLELTLTTDPYALTANMLMHGTSKATNLTIGFQVGGNVSFGPFSGMFSAAYLVTPGGQSGVTITAGGSAGPRSGTVPVDATSLEKTAGLSGSIGPVISNGTSLADQEKWFDYVHASAGEGLYGAGVSVATGTNSQGKRIWDFDPAWSPSIGSPVQYGLGKSYTWIFPIN